jgi:hypothetical protein
MITEQAKQVESGEQAEQVESGEQAKQVESGEPSVKQSNRMITLYTDRCINITFDSDDNLIPINSLLNQKVNEHNSWVKTQRIHGIRPSPIGDVIIAPRSKMNVNDIVEILNTHYNRSVQYEIYLTYLKDKKLLDEDIETLPVYSHDGTINIDLVELIKYANNLKVELESLSPTDIKISQLKQKIF